MGESWVRFPPRAPDFFQHLFCYYSLQDKSELLSLMMNQVVRNVSYVYYINCRHRKIMKVSALSFLSENKPRSNPADNFQKQKHSQKESTRWLYKSVDHFRIELQFPRTITWSRSFVRENTANVWKLMKVVYWLEKPSLECKHSRNRVVLKRNVSNFS